MLQGVAMLPRALRPALFALSTALTPAALTPAALTPALFAFTAALGCGSTETTSPDTASSHVPRLRLINPASGACVAVPQDRAAGVPITVELFEPVKGEGYKFYLKPPGGCEQLEPCGHIQLFVGDKPNNAGYSAATVFPIDLLSSPEVPLSGKVDVVAKLVNDGGKVVEGDDKKPVEATLSFTAKASCGGDTGGTGGSGGGSSSSTGGSSSSSGTGGTGGGSSSSSGGSSSSTGSGGSGGGSSSSTGGSSSSSSSSTGSGGSGGGSSSSSTGP
jgi:hypothetical protein